MTLSDSFLTDAKTRFVPISGIKRGSLVFFEFVMQRDPWELAHPIVFQEYGPTDLMRVSVTLPAGWSVRHTWLSGAGTEPTVAGTTHTWELRDMAAPDSDPLSPTAPMVCRAATASPTATPSLER